MSNERIITTEEAHAILGNRMAYGGDTKECARTIINLAAAVERLAAERDAAVATIAGRTTPPTPAEAAAHKAASGEWLLVMAPTLTTLPTQVVVDPPTRPLAYITLYVPLDRLRRPCAWPVVTP